MTDTDFIRVVNKMVADSCRQWRTTQRCQRRPPNPPPVKVQL